MRFSALFFLLILTCLYLTLAQGSYEDCCMKYVKGVRNSIKKMVKSYRRQETDGSCNIPAIVFTMRRGRLFCADPKEKWVTDLMQNVDFKKKIKKHNRKSQRG